MDRRRAQRHGHAAAWLTVLALCAPAQARAAEWVPPPRTTWQWQLDGKLDLGVPADMYDVDLFDTPTSAIQQLHARGTHVVCYFSAGSYERWRPDARRFPRSVRGRALEGWRGERWLDIRRLRTLGTIMERRLDLCRRKGFDAVEADNVDGYANRSGFRLRGADQLRYNRFLARAAHRRGLSIGLKNDLDQVRSLVRDFDWALDEQCFQYDECDRLEPFTRAGKAVFVAEYRQSDFCSRANAMGLMAMLKRVSLGAWRQPCW
ncbi:endo alpha-1,4 polygalactosaminidase [Candidatus Solirubrobacter pratensis]|uniref:endo alpha-1,4 polygalactosaminidase n=1 Tax=Candidatus Solirubrobacter pratensis TaxID=1298857 RepID=UPI000426E659|nr:endo alpha-1,4 polygalactosaminidase [Candidatus Solirubrobacter pratensis]